MPLTIPDGSRLFVDANLLAYHQVRVPGLTEPVTDFVERVEAHAIVGYTSTHVIAEAIHKVILAETAAQYNFPQTGILNRLRKDHSLLRSLTHSSVTPEFERLGLIIEPVHHDDLVLAEEFITKYSLLTNDSVVLAVMRRLGLVDLATNDDDFDHVDWLTVWKPR